MKKKILIITYYWPPSGGAGVQRWLKHVKYLIQLGFEIVIYTADTSEYPVNDNSLIDEIPKEVTVLKQPIWEPYNWYKKFVGIRKGEKVQAGFINEKKSATFKNKLSVWIRGNFFIPDARKYWIKPSIKYLKNYLNQNAVDAVISTGPPHSMHLIALGLKKHFTSLKWIADFRDPWTNIDFYDQLMLTKLADFIHKKLERKVLNTADKIVTVSWHWAKDLEKICNRKVDVITNGYDSEDFDNLQMTVETEFVFNHIGSLNKDRNPHSFWIALKECLEEIPDLSQCLKIRLIGSIDFEVIKSIKQHNLDSYLEKIEYLSHKEVIKQMSSSQILLLPLNDTPNTLGVVPGKLFEYLAAKRPILAIGNINGDSARIIKETGAGVIVGFEDIMLIKKEIIKLYSQYKSNQLKSDLSSIEQYSRKESAKKYSEILHKIIKS